jgi:4-amino-4-deoxy-L-arabinose transferase-like glycosyltransferase
MALGVAVVQLTPFLDTVPGLHGDEAWSGLRARAILDGQISAYGLTVYTGPVHQILLLPLLETLGYRVWVLRSLTVITSLLSIWLFFLVVRRLFGAPLAGIAALVLASMPWFALYGRGATEHFALNPVLALAATWCLLAAMDAGARKRDALAGTGGVLLALGTWNHLIFAPVPLVLAVVALTRLRRRLIRFRMLAVAVAGFFLGALPRLLPLLTEREANQLGLGIYAGVAIGGLQTRFAESLAIFAATLHGDILYRRYAGELVWPTPWVAPALLAAALVVLTWRLLSGKEQHPSRIWHPASCLALFSLLTMAMAPEHADRYFLLIHYLVVPFIAMLFRLALLAPLPPAAGAVALGTFLAFNVSRTAINFHSAHLSSGGKISILWLVGKMETSNHFIRTDLLYEHLREREIREVYAEFFIAFPLAFYDLDRRHFRRIGTLETMAQPFDEGEHSSAAIVSYLGGPGRFDPRAYDARALWTFRQFEIGGFRSPSSSASPGHGTSPRARVGEEAASILVRGSGIGRSNAPTPLRLRAGSPTPDGGLTKPARAGAGAAAPGRGPGRPRRCRARPRPRPG